MDYVEKDFGKIMKHNAQALRHDLLPAGTDCFRVYDRNLSRFPVTVDIYGHYAKVTDYGDEPMTDETRETCLDICSRMLYLEKANVVYAYRAKRVEREQHEKNELEAIKTTVHEDGLSFLVDLTTYVDTGLFLDHSQTRHLIRERSANADVLNLFSYTGSFSVYAAAGFANSVTSVDMSATYTKWAEENLRANGYSGDMYKCICMDATKFVREAIKDGKKYDIIIFDPPSFSNSRKMDGDFDIARDYVQWIKNLFTILKKTGIILFSTNLGTFQMDRRRLRGLSIKEITGAVVAPGFVKGRTGTARSWMMAFDDDSLSLDWSEPEKKSEKSTDKVKKDSEKRYSEKKSYGERRNGERSDRKPYGDRRQGERRYGDRDRRDSERRERSYDPDRHERTYKSERSDRPERPYRSERSDRYERSDRPERSERREYGSYRDRDNRSSRDGYRGSSYSDKRRYSRDDSENCEQRRERRSFDRDERSERRSDRPYRSYDRDDRRERSYDRDRSFNRSSDRSRSYGDKRSFQRSENGEKSFERKPYNRDSRPSTKKPYGYDSFKPARSREDSTDFFWNSEDLDPKPKKED